MSEQTALVTNPTRLALLSTEVAVKVKVPAAALTCIRGRVFAIARSSGGAGADTLTALIAFMAKAAGDQVTVVDFSQVGDEGPAWDHSELEYACV